MSISSLNPFGNNDEAVDNQAMEDRFAYYRQIVRKAAPKDTVQFSSQAQQQLAIKRGTEIQTPPEKHSLWEHIKSWFS